MFEILSNLFYAALNSTGRVLIGFLISSIVGIGFALIISKLGILKKIVLIFIEILRPISPLAWVPVALLIFGTGNSPAIFVVFIATFFPIFINALHGFIEKEQENNEFAVIYRLKSFQKLFYLTIPSAKPVIFVGLKVGFGVGWMSIVAAEQMGISSGLGTQIQIARFTLNTTMLTLSMLTIGIIGMIFNQLFDQFVKKQVGWN